MTKVNLGFAKLRDHVPEGKKNKKMSKVDTLRAAVDYIKQLQKLLDGDEDGVEVEHIQDTDQQMDLGEDACSVTSSTDSGMDTASNTTALDSLLALQAVAEDVCQRQEAEYQAQSDRLSPAPSLENTASPESLVDCYSPAAEFVPELQQDNKSSLFDLTSWLMA